MTNAVDAHRVCPTPASPPLVSLVPSQGGALSNAVPLTFESFPSVPVLHPVQVGLVGPHARESAAQPLGGPRHSSTFFAWNSFYILPGGLVRNKRQNQRIKRKAFRDGGEFRKLPPDPGRTRHLFLSSSPLYFHSFSCPLLPVPVSVFSFARHLSLLSPFAFFLRDTIPISQRRRLRRRSSSSSRLSRY